MNRDCDYIFDSAEEALKWAVEVLRVRRLPKSNGFWREIVAEHRDDNAVWLGAKNYRLPTDPDDRLDVALNVLDALAAIEREAETLGLALRLWAWGDWVNERKLAAALAIQEKCRREGLRVRMSYRYTYEQIGVVMGCNKKTAWRKVQEGLAHLATALQARGLLAVVEGSEREDVVPVRDVALFKAVISDQ